MKRLYGKSTLPIPFIRVIILSFLAVLGIIGFSRFQESTTFINEGDELLRQRKPEEAILHYLKAYDLFPLRGDVMQSLKGARLLVESEAQYGTIYKITAEVQEVPEVLPPVVLKPGEVHVPMLMYHHIRDNPRPNDPIWAALNVSTNQLDQQLSYFKTNEYHSITLDDLFNALDGKTSLPSQSIILTFDDGYRSFYENAYPLLKKYQMKAVAFIMTDVENTSAYMSWSQIEEIDKSGLVQFAAHTRHHANLAILSQRLMEEEVAGSKIELESHLKKPIRWFAYPYGSYSMAVIKAVKQAGFVGAASTIYGTVQSKDKLNFMPRLMVDGRFSLDTLIKRITY